MKKYSLDLFDVLSKIDTKSENFYSTLSDDEKKSFSPLVIMRWLSGTSEASQIMLLNEFVNPLVFRLGDNKELLYRLLVACSSGKKKNYNWLSSKKSQSNNLAVRVISEYFEISEREASMYQLPHIDEIVEMASELGWQRDELNKLKKEFSK